MGSTRRTTRNFHETSIGKVITELFARTRDGIATLALTNPIPKVNGASENFNPLELHEL